MTIQEPPRRRVLVVEDNEDIAEMLESLLEFAGYDVQTAGDGLTGVSIARRFVPDVVLLDLGLPGVDGFEVAQRLRAEPALAGAFLVAVADFGLEADVVRGRASGFDLQLVKPLYIEHLLALLRARFRVERG